MLEPTRRDILTTTIRGEHRARSGVAAFASWQRSLDLVLQQVMIAGDSPPDLVVMFAAREYADAAQELVRQAKVRTGAETLIGCFGSGCIGNGRELERTPGLSMLALWMPGARLEAQHIDQATLRSTTGNAPPRAGADDDVRGWLVLTDPYSFDVQRLIQRLQDQSPGVPVLGGMSSCHTGAGKQPARLFIDDQVFEEGAVTLVLRGAFDIVPIVTQSCEPIGDTWTVTDVDRTAVLSISGRPAIDRLIETVAALSPEQQRRAKRHLVVGLAADEYRDEYHRGDFLIRGLLGVDHARAALLVGDRPRVGQTIQFQLRDPVTAGIDMHQHLLEARAMLGERKPFAALMASCSGRGSGLFGKPDHDVQALQSAFPGMAVGGFISTGEIGPVGKTCGLHSFSASIMLLVER